MSIRTLFIFMFPAILSSAMAGTQPANPNLNPTTRQVLGYLDSIYSKQVLSGYNVYPHTPDDYEQTGKQAAIWGRDIQWLGDVEAHIRHAHTYRYILTLHWHWFFDGDSAWTGQRKQAVDLGRLVTPDTPENLQLMKELAATANILQRFQDADIPVLWRPLHEIDGGWFWWTDKTHPENTAQLWRIMFDYFTHTRKLNNLIWIYSAGEGNKTVTQRQGFYPGSQYVDISGLDIYHVNVKTEVDKYNSYFETMKQVSPGKMLACGECDDLPDPVKMAEGITPKWLYALPWWGTPAAGRPVDWATHTMRHDLVVTLDELPALGSGNIAPHLGILKPADDGSAWFNQQAPMIEAFAVDRDGTIDRVEFYANGRRQGVVTQSPYRFEWTDAQAGFYEIHAVAFDNIGASSSSNRIRIVVGMTDLAREKPAVASSGDQAHCATDGNYYTAWISENSPLEWIYVDLGTTQTIDRINLLWGWKIHAADFSIDVATVDPENPQSWTTVYTCTQRAYQPWKATDRIQFASISARFVRLNATRRAGNQNWAGYNLMAFEVPVKEKSKSPFSM